MIGAMHKPRSASSWSLRALHRHVVALAVALVGLACEAVSGETPVAAAQQQAVVEVFVTDWCPYCQRLEAFLKENKVAYQRKNIEQNAQFRAEHDELGGGGIPVTRINGRQVIRGFQPEAIGKALGLRAKMPTPPVQSSAALRMRPSTS
jgi:glutaredoxin